MQRWFVVTGLMLLASPGCGSDDGGGGSGGSSTGGSSGGGSGGASTGGSSSGGSGGSSSGGSSSGGAAGSATGGAAGSATGGSAGSGGSSTGGSGGSATGGSGGGGSGGSGGSDGGTVTTKDCNGMTFVGSCKSNAAGSGCVEYYGSYDANTVKTVCETGGQGVHSTGKCVTTGSIGSCAGSSLPGKCGVTVQFPPITTALAQSICSASGGTFYPP